MQAAQIKVFYVMPLPARERIYYKRQWGFFSGSANKSFYSFPAYGLPGTRVSRLVVSEPPPPLTRAPDICRCFVFVTRVLPEGLGLPGWSGVLEYAHSA